MKEKQLDLFQKIDLKYYQNHVFFYFPDFQQKSNEKEMKVALSDKHKINTKWIFIGASLTAFCFAVAAAIGIIHLGKRSSKDNISLIPIEVKFTFEFVISY